MDDKKVFYNQFDMDTVEKLANIVKNNDLGEISIKNGDCCITVKGKKAVAAAAPAVSVPMAAAQTAEAPAVSGSAAQAVSGKQIKAPIVGTFYAAPSPDSKPFVSVGDRVKKGDVIFIIESMKVMNEVQSDYDGVIKEICAQSGDPVEFDQTIMIIE